MLRRGEVRVNKKRAKPEQRIVAGDELRLPPLADATRPPQDVPAFWCERIAAAVLFEDDDFLILNKPAGIAVHGGSEQPYGVIDAVRQVWGAGYAELAHRLDRDTSGVLVLGKNRAALAGFQTQMQAGEVEKRYLCLVDGHWNPATREVRLRLAKGRLQGGERMVVGTADGRKRALISACCKPLPTPAYCKQRSTPVAPTKSAFRCSTAATASPAMTNTASANSTAPCANSATRGCFSMQQASPSPMIRGRYRPRRPCPRLPPTF